MRILYNSKELFHKDPFGTLIPGQDCRLSIHVPCSVGATGVQCIISHEDGTAALTVDMPLSGQKGAYDVFSGTFSFAEPGLYFYYFSVIKKSGAFRLFKQGSDTNMEAGDLWQVSCIPADFTTPDWAKGATIYQIFPDRFCKAGDCDLTGKLQPYTIHEKWDEEVSWQPTKEGLILNNDFFGGNFKGITEKLPYIASLGATILYLNPISKSFSSHRYDTGDYKTPDPMLGTLEDFRSLCEEAHKLGIKVILDGVFSHTGSDSLYFDKNRTFGGKGAHCSKDSPYYSWYTFHQWPDSYNSWWGFDTLPTVNKLDPAFLDYIIRSDDSVVSHWLNNGADGFRLDVADELPNEFMDILKKRVREIRPDALVMGEVWEDASNKVAYDMRRRYFVDGTLDSCMNYPFRTAILNFTKDRDDGHSLAETVMTIAENYPAQVLACNMNLLGSHDTPRILTALVDDYDGPREVRATRKLSKAQRQIAQDRLYLATFLQYTLPGAPSIYYGDEAGMEGSKDPFNRRTFPWGEEDPDLLRHYRQLGRLRQEQKALRLGDIRFFQAQDGQLGFTRSYNGKTLRVHINRSPDAWAIPAGKVVFAQNLRSVAPEFLELAPMGLCVTEDE